MIHHNIVNHLVGMAQRLASTIPIASKDDSIPDLVNQIVTKSTTALCLRDLLVLTIYVVAALELVSNATYHIPKALCKVSSIPVRGKHLDRFSTKDWIFITINKCMTGVFIYCYFGYLWSVRKNERNDHHAHGDEHTDGHRSFEHNCCAGGRGIWNLEEISLMNTFLPIPVLFVTYDFFYTLLHWFLHIKSIYSYIHKHHHHQKAPSRANIDAVNVHPLEFFLGEFNHVLSLHLVVKGIPLWGFHGMDVSWVGALIFITVGGILAGLNHTRHDVAFRVMKKEKMGWTLYDSKHHDVHHRIPQSNYGQYTVLWDRIFGTFREYDENDRVNPAYQLDPVTGQTIKSTKEE
ncbi:hypothetical protein HJC23_013191 [Cyclotella cryptica]|uniref:Fatty acid hydroxylase domain-containing protein n=1 Tax=Cyclotella cryptica TaxID=29204 RepID=A0ABD3QDF0_9STRA|eukprot:CCRYP_006591-RB/>CCRYP_006591-RB protein AED:0.40 eAED:0.40 QI:282/1/1/1/0.5/0.33/3/271/347